MPSLRLSVFGTPRLACDGQPIELNLRKAQALLVYLAVSGQPHSRDALATLLWPESDARESRARLRRTLHRLNETLGDEVLDSARDTIGLRPGADLWLDSAAFRQHLAAAPAGTMAPERLGHLTAAVELYADDFLAGFTLPDSPAFDEWQFFQRESLRQLYGQALEQLVQAYRTQQAWDQAIAYARRWVALDGLHEPAHRALMRLYAWAGQPAAALRQYQECARILDAELGATPEEATTALYEAIRTRQLGALEPAAAQPTVAPAPQAHQRYLVEERLAEGGQGQVFRGRDQVTGEPVAIKWLKGELADQHLDLVARFVREGAVLRRLDHPNIVGILETFEQDGRYAIVMEYVPGGSLRALLDQAGRLPLAQVLAIGLELADALSRAHHLGIIHRDLKPENVLLAADGAPRLTDFGMARWDQDADTLTQTGTLFGSPAYMSPEAVRGEELDARSDIWSLGVLLFELLAGRRPFEGAHITPVLASILESPIPDLRQYRPDVPVALVHLLERMLRKDRALRLSSMRQVAAELELIHTRPAAAGQLPKPHAGTAATPAARQTSPTPVRAAAPDSGGGLVFVARERELSWLDAMLDAVLSGQSRVAFVTGEAGQGKTALLLAFALRAQMAYPDIVIAGGNCNAYTGTGDPYLPFRQILEMLTGNDEACPLVDQLRQEHAERLWSNLPVAVEALLDFGPGLIDTFVSGRRLLGRAAAYAKGGAIRLRELQDLLERRAAAPADTQQDDLFGQYAKFLQALARRAPLLLLLDDLQWADPGSANLLLDLGRRLQGCPVLIVGAYRPADVAIGRDGLRHPLERVVSELQRDRGEILLDLSRAEGRAFVDALLDSEPNLIGEAFRATLYHQTGGQPLFTVELLRDLQERGVLARDSAGRWAVTPRLDWSSLPARVEGVIGERVGRLDPRLRELLQAASVEGEEFTAEVVARALGADEHEVVRRFSRELDQIHHLVRALGVRRDDGVRLSRYQFQHNLIQRYLYQTLDEVERPYQHEAIGNALAALHGPRAPEIAAQLVRHYEAAQLPEQVAIYSEQAGDQARRSAALDEGIRYYQAALAAWPASDPAGRARVLRKQGECQWVRGQLQDALGSFEVSYALADAVGSREGAGAAQRLLGRLSWEQGERDHSLQHYGRALMLLESGPESAELAHAISAISQMHMLAFDFDQAIVWGERALAMAERLGSEQVAITALANLGSAYFATGDAERGEAMLRRSWRRAAELNLQHDACRAANNLGVCLTDLGLYAQAREVLAELHTYAAQMQVPLFAGSALITQIELSWLTGRWDEALARRHELLAWLAQGQPISYVEVHADVMLAWMHNDLGQPEAALQILEQARPKIDSRAEIQSAGPYLGQLVRALAMLGRAAEATAKAQQYLALIEGQRAYLDTQLSSLVVCQWFARRAPALPAELAASLAQLAAAHARYGGPVPAASLSEGRGLAALSQRDAPGAVGALREAAAQWQALGRPYDQARALLDLARALSLAGDTGQARAALGQAQSLAEALAGQLDGELRAAFLGSQLLQELWSAGAARQATPARPPAAVRQSEQQIRFSTAPDGVRIAYATVGSGPVLVKAANWLSHLEFDWNSPVWRHWLLGLSRQHTLVRYDERGCGLSDWDVDEFSVDAWVRDLETVVDTLGLERFPLLGLSQGGPVAITYAVRHPERVSHLILYGSYAQGWWRRKLAPHQREETEMMLTMSKLGWGRSNPAFRQVFTSMFIPDATIEQMHWFNDLQRLSTSPENAVAFLRAFYEIDVTDLAPQVTTPTLVMHAREDVRIPFAAGRELAALIPGARFVPLESKNHILLETEPAWQRFLDEIHVFIDTRSG
jgi:DNA-binding SARP family transcriptional activator/pimeloyl-ACP methyl ester carboxylesterase/tRNA A-37 threonylcarbamoyl transferase component Bud32